ncbi:MAG: tRNA preQ1(34) S-adenosylmethionine ribosyltransferase-isomerase QueA [Myxococcota bacterium]|nr:tRNA preQ1(34) S-adenosylmethionine ribosyltransferase-isomerase QueA [Myxococcota bacterium]
MTSPSILDAHDFELPPELIAQHPLPERDASKLLCLSRQTGGVRHQTIRGLPDLLRDGDLIVLNATRVLPARLKGQRESGGAAEALLLGPEPGDAARFRALLKISGRLRPGLKLRFGPGVEAEIAEIASQGEVILAFSSGVDPYSVGHPPLPPYIQRDAAPSTQDRDRYQTVFARVPGAVAAPTAGLHLTDALLAQIARAGVRRAEVVLHVGLGTFRPLRDADLESGQLHAERFELPTATADAVAETRARGGRVVAVGTTATRVLESQACGNGRVAAAVGETRLFLKPGDPFQVVDALLTNFHLPRSSLMLLVAAFAGTESVLSAYQQAIAANYRFYSYGDAMFVS